MLTSSTDYSPSLLETVQRRASRRQDAVLMPIRELKGRVTFMAHDFFAPQTVQADVIYYRWSLRNWADKYCILALQAQIPMLKPGARIIIQDVILPEPGAAPLWKEKNARYVIRSPAFPSLAINSDHLL
jgi:O-methyltransferase domain